MCCLLEDSDYLDYGTADWELGGAIINGLYSFSSSVPITCPTGNCTWPTFSTLALCSSCEDITNTIEISGCSTDVCTNYNMDSRHQVSCMTNEAQGDMASNCTQWPPCNYTTNARISTNITYRTPENASFQGVECEYYIEPPKHPSSNVSLLEESWCDGDYLSRKSAILNETDSEAFKETSNSFYSTKPFLNISNLALITALNLDPKDTSFSLSSCPEKTLSEVIQCRIEWCTKVYEDVKMASLPTKSNSLKLMII